jgi:hypothetical protein
MANFDIFEIFGDGSYVWRACVSGRYAKDRRLQELAETSHNKFCALDLAAQETLLPIGPVAPQNGASKKGSTP